MNTKTLPVVPTTYRQYEISGVRVSRVLLHAFLIVAACAPLVALVANMAQRYPLDMALLDITLVDAILLIAATSLPVFVLSRLGVDWRADPEEHL